MMATRTADDARLTKLDTSSWPASMAAVSSPYQFRHRGPTWVKTRVGNGRLEAICNSPLLKTPAEVAFLHEELKIRAAGIAAEILVFNEANPVSDDDSRWIRTIADCIGLGTRTLLIELDVVDELQPLRDKLLMLAEAILEREPLNEAELLSLLR